MDQVERPDFVSDEHLEYLDELRESGDTNMFGARPYLMWKFTNLSKDEALEVLMYWMKTFSERHARNSNRGGRGRPGEEFDHGSSSRD